MPYIVVEDEMSAKFTTIGDLDDLIEAEARQRGERCTPASLAANRIKAAAEYASLERQGLLDYGAEAQEDEEEDEGGADKFA